jgi:hypothetical protein
VKLEFCALDDVLLVCVVFCANTLKFKLVVATIPADMMNARIKTDILLFFVVINKTPQKKYITIFQLMILAFYHRQFDY